MASTNNTSRSGSRDEATATSNRRWIPVIRVAVMVTARHPEGRHRQFERLLAIVRNAGCEVPVIEPMRASFIFIPPIDMDNPLASLEDQHVVITERVFQGIIWENQGEAQPSGTTTGDRAA